MPCFQFVYVLPIGLCYSSSFKGNVNSGVYLAVNDPKGTIKAQSITNKFFLLVLSGLFVAEALQAGHERFPPLQDADCCKTVSLAPHSPYSHLSTFSRAQAYLWVPRRSLEFRYTPLPPTCCVPAIWTPPYLLSPLWLCSWVSLCSFPLTPLAPWRSRT